MRKFMPLDEEDVEAAQPLLVDRTMILRPEEEEEVEKEEAKKVRSVRRIRSRPKVERPVKKIVEKPEVKEEEKLELELEKKKKEKRIRPKKILKKICPEPCIPEICCADMEGKIKKFYQISLLFVCFTISFQYEFISFLFLFFFLGKVFKIDLWHKSWKKVRMDDENDQYEYWKLHD